MNKLKIGVFMGGKSIEREVSFNSGRTIADHLDTSKFNVIPIFQREDGTLFILPWKFLHRGKITDFKHRLETEAEEISWGQLKTLIDFVYLAVHGRLAEDGTLQGVFEVLGIPYLGSNVFVSALCMDKSIQRTWLEQNGIDVPKGILIKHQEIELLQNFRTYPSTPPSESIGTNGEYTTASNTQPKSPPRSPRWNAMNGGVRTILNKIESAGIKFPLIVKACKEGSSFGVYLVKTKKDLAEALNKAAHIFPEQAQDVLIEEKVEGIEFSSITLIDNQTDKPLPLPPTEIVNMQGKDIFDYEQKYMPGQAIKFTPARCSKENLEKIKKTCIKAMEVLGIETIARIDGFLTKDNKVIIFDPNTLSGMSPTTFLFRQAAEEGMSHTDLINHLLETDLKKYGLSVNQTSSKKKIQDKINVVVLLGGDTNEREVSLDSGRNACYKLSPKKYNVIPIFVDSNFEPYKITKQLLVRNKTNEVEHSLTPEMKIEWEDLPKLAEFAFLGLHGGRGENGSVQGMLEMLGLPYNGPGVFTSSLCMDKFKTNQFLKSAGLNTPEATLVNLKDWQTNQEKVLSSFTRYPYIAKPHNDGCSIEVAKVSNQKELVTAVEAVFSLGKEYALVEEIVQGMELTVGVVGNNNPTALPPSQSLSENEVLSMQEKFLPGAGENQTPAPLTQKTIKLVQENVEAAFKAVKGFGYSRIDCFYQSKEVSPTGKERVVILEINTLPALTPATCLFHQAAELGTKPMDFINQLVELGFEQHQTNSKLTKVKEGQIQRP
jgi:UDP-N-acetylmuramate--alanine ligase